MQHTKRLCITALLLLATAGSALAHGGPGHDNNQGRGRGHDKHNGEDCAFAVNPFVVDPNRTGGAASAWVPGIGLPDDTGNSRFALVLQKTAPIEVFAAAGASVLGEEGIVLDELGFDIRNDSYCSPGSPRFNVVTDVGVFYFFGCDFGIHTPIPGTDWTRVRFTDADAFPAEVGQPAWPGFGNVTVMSIQIIHDETGTAILDNIDINGTLVGRPGIVQCEDDDDDKPGKGPKDKDKDKGKNK